MSLPTERGATGGLHGKSNWPDVSKQLRLRWLNAVVAPTLMQHTTNDATRCLKAADHFNIMRQVDN